MAGGKRYVKYNPNWCFRYVWSPTKHRTRISDIKHDNLKFTVQFDLYVPRVRTCHHLCSLQTLVIEKRAAWGSLLGCSLKYPPWHGSSFLIKVPGASVFKVKNLKRGFFKFDSSHCQIRIFFHRTNWKISLLGFVED